MSEQGCLSESNSRKERKERQLFALKLLLKDKLPWELRKEFLRSRNMAVLDRPYTLYKGTENAITFFKGKYLLGDNYITQIIYATELDLRKNTGAYMMDLKEYFPEKRFNIIDITYKGVGEDEIFSILKSQEIDENGIVMVKDQQKEYEEEMYDEFYYFLVEFDA